MNLEKELILLLEKAKQTDEYFNPYLIVGILDAIRETCSNDDEIIPLDLINWVDDMWSR